MCVLAYSRVKLLMRLTLSGRHIPPGQSIIVLGNEETGGKQEEDDRKVKEVMEELEVEIRMDGERGKDAERN